MASRSSSYERRKVESIETAVCIKPSCREPAAQDALLCGPHLDAKRTDDRSLKRKQRAQRRADHACLDCGAPLAAEETIWCAMHRIKRGRGVQRLAVGLDSLDARQQRIRAAMQPDPTDGDRMRYVGAGYKTALRLDQQDLRYARDAIRAGEAGLHHYETPDVKALGIVARADIKSAALHQLFRAVGHLEDVLLRRGHDITRNRHHED